MPVQNGKKIKVAVHQDGALYFTQMRSVHFGAQSSCCGLTYDRVNTFGKRLVDYNFYYLTIIGH